MYRTVYSVYSLAEYIGRIKLSPQTAVETQDDSDSYVPAAQKSCNLCITHSLHRCR